jgi:hypothetical protein
MILRLLIAKNNVILGSLHLVDNGELAIVSEIHAEPIFSAEMYEVDEFLSIHRKWPKSQLNG